MYYKIKYKSVTLWAKVTSFSLKYLKNAKITTLHYKYIAWKQPHVCIPGLPPYLSTLKYKYKMNIK